MSDSTSNAPGNYEDFPDGPGHIPDPRLSRAVGAVLVGIFLVLILLMLLGS